MELSDPLRFLKPAVRALGRYTLPPRPHRVKVNQNENPFELPPALKEEVLARMRAAPWGRYPDFVPSSLLERLARFAGWTPDGVLAGNGSNELIGVLLQSVVGPGTKVVLAVPTFTLYASMVAIQGGEVVPVPLVADSLAFDVDALLGAARASQARVVIACSPNNPTGSWLEPAALRRLLELDALVVVDEAYHEFSGQSVVPLLREHANLVVLRTFSKAMALAALRVGYLLARPELASELDKVRLPYNLNRFSTIAAELVLERHGELLAPRVAELIALRESLAAQVAAIPGFRVWPSRANFLLVGSEWTPREVLATLDRRGILARDVSGYPGLSSCFRLSVGTPEENQQVVEGLLAHSRGGAR